MNETTIQNQSIFFAPIWTDDYSNFVSKIKKDERYVTLEKNNVPQYMLPYITRIYKDDDLFIQFELKPEVFPKLGFFCDALNLEVSPSLNTLRLSCFSTGCVFAEFHILHNGLSIEKVTDRQ